MLACNHNGYWWRTSAGKWIAVKDMKATHLINALRGMEKKNKKFTKHYHVLADEARQRGLVMEDFRQSLPFSVC